MPIERSDLYRANAPLLIHTRRGALVALCLGILLVLRDFRYLFEFYVPEHTWVTRFDFPATLFDIIVHLCCAALFTGGLIFICLRSRGGERAYLAIFACAAVLGPIGDIPAVASIHAYTWLQTLFDLALVPSAVWMYRNLPSYSTWSAARLADRR